MISSLQPTRPRVPISSSSKLSSDSSPRNQMEAMPPVPLQQVPKAAKRPQVVLDAAKRHPVFFTDRLKKAPTGVATGGAISPVAMGYVFNDRIVKRDGAAGGVKL